MLSNNKSEINNIVERHMSRSSLHVHGERDHGHLRTLFKRARNKLELSPVSMPSAERISDTAHIYGTKMCIIMQLNERPLHSMCNVLLLCGTFARSISRANNL